MTAHGESFRKTFVKGIVAGLGWAIGASVGFTVFITFLGGLLSLLDKLPVIGTLVAPLEQLLETNDSPKKEFVPSNK